MKLLVIIAGSLVAVLAVIMVGFVVAAGPEPHIAIPPEKLWQIGPWHITSTIMGAWLAMIIIIAVSLVATRSMQLIPGGMQNFIEGIIDFLVTQCEEIAGKEHGRRFFVVAGTFFIFILVANWAALLPFYKNIGLTQDYGHKIFHEIDDQEAVGQPFDEDHHWAAWHTNERGGVGIVATGAEDFKFDIEEGWTPGEALDAYIVALAEHFTRFERQSPEDAVPPSQEVTAAAEALQADPDAPVLLSQDDPLAVEANGVESPALGIVVMGIDFPEDKLTVVYPFFRAAYSDVNNTLALALVAFATVWVWGFQAHGVGYLGKFFIAPWKNPIMTFVGILELVSEFIRIISWSMRLFGNIFAGSVLLLIMAFLVPFVAPIAIYGLELFVGLIQAIVFSLLVLVFGLGAVESHHDDEHHDDHEPHDGHHEEEEHAAGAPAAPHEPGAVQA